MTLQNQIPRIIIGILLITFSYAIVGFMIDMMWTATHMGINVITGSNPPLTNPAGCADTGGKTLIIRADKDGLLSTPFYYADSILETQSRCSGIWATSVGLSNVLGSVLKGLIEHAIDYGFGTEINHDTCNWSTFFSFSGTVYASDCFKKWTGLTPGAVIGGVMGWLAKIAAIFIVMCIIIWTLFRVWLQIMKAYIMIILYAITGPLWIIMGLLPSRPLGFERWLRRIFANLVVFPATALLFVTAAILMNSFQPGLTAGHQFIPPLMGNPNMQDFGYIMAFGILLVTPGLTDIIRSSVGAVGKQGQMAVGSIQTTMAQGSSVPRGITRGVGQKVFGYNPVTQRAGIGLQLLAGKVATGKDPGYRNKFVNWLAGSRGEIKRGK